MFTSISRPLSSGIVQPVRYRSFMARQPASGMPLCMFKNKTGDYAFEIIGAGPDAGHVEEFISSVTRQIRRANREV